MMDVVPPVFGGGSKLGRNRKMPGRKRREPSNVLRVEWRPPARVLGKINNKKPSKIVRGKGKFPIGNARPKGSVREPRRADWLEQRREVATKIASKYPPRYKGRLRQQDENKNGPGKSAWGQSGAGLALPPYGGIMAGPRSLNQSKSGKDIPAKAKEAKIKAAELPAIGADERDVPYVFVEALDSDIREDGASLQLPHRWWSLTPASLPARKKTTRQGKRRPKFKVPKIKMEWRPGMMNMALLLAGLILLTIFMGNLVHASSGISSVLGVQDKLKSAYARLMEGGAALAETKFDESEKYFKDAEDLLVEAEAEVFAAEEASGRLLGLMDLTGTSRTSGELLEAGRNITTAGQRIARGAGMLAEGHVWEEGAGTKGASLTDAVKAAREEFLLAAKDLEKIEAVINKVDNPFLPAGAADQMALIQQTVPAARLALQSFIEQSDLLLMMLGADHDRQYLVLFQNNHELRPTGGFIGTVGLVGIDRGVVEEIDIRTVYDGDGQLKELIEPPRPLKRVSDRWYLRDSNWFIDYPVSARKAADFLEKEGGPTVDGVIAMTPDVIRELLKITGPIDMPEWGLTVDADSFWIIAQHEVTYGYDREANEPKRFLAELTPLLLTRLFAAKDTSSLEIMIKLTELMNEKHLLFYFRHQEVQERLKEAGWAGNVPAGKKGLVGVVNANIAGHKSDQFIEQEIDYDLRVEENGALEVLLTIKREHRGPAENPEYEYPRSENPAEKDNIVYQRVLVPREAELMAAGGWTAERDLPPIMEGEDVFAASKPDADVAEWERGQIEHESGTLIGEEAGYGFFSNWVITRPGETSVAWYKYRLPTGADVPSMFDPAGSVEAYVFKQPGDNRTTARITLKLPPGMRVHKVLPESGMTQTSGREITYRAKATQDLMLGAVLVKE